MGKAAWSEGSGRLAGPGDWQATGTWNPRSPDVEWPGSPPSVGGWGPLSVSREPFLPLQGRPFSFSVITTAHHPPPIWKTGGYWLGGDWRPAPKACPRLAAASSPSGCTPIRASRHARLLSVPSTTNRYATRHQIVYGAGLTFWFGRKKRTRLSVERSYRRSISRSQRSRREGRTCSSPRAARGCR
jgi:hypothetical protein